MSQAEKLLERMRANARNDWAMSDVEKVAKAFGCDIRRPRGGSSHATISHDAMVEILTVPYARPIKTVYIVRLVMFIDSIIGSEQ